VVTVSLLGDIGGTQPELENKICVQCSGLKVSWLITLGVRTTQYILRVTINHECEITSRN